MLQYLQRELMTDTGYNATVSLYQVNKIYGTYCVHDKQVSLQLLTLH
jgi:hypothetical protein